MLIKKTELRKIIREEVIKEAFGGETHAAELTEDLREKILSWSEEFNVDPRRVIRQLAKDVAGEYSKRRYKFSHLTEYDDLLNSVMLLGRQANASLKDMYDVFTFLKKADKL